MSNKPLKLCIIFGTRPEIIKLYSVMTAAIDHDQVNAVLVHTGQHYDYEMSQVFLEELRLPECDHFLNVRSGTHGQQTAALLTSIEEILVSEIPDVVAVVGDTNTVLAGALVGAKLQIPVVHVEAGCRSFDFDMPEEINRLAADSISSILFAPSYVAALNLLFEGRSKNRVFMAGNTVVDIVDATKEMRAQKPLDGKLKEHGDVVVTLHRQENVDDSKRLTSLLEALNQIQHPLVFPMHPRTAKRIREFNLQKIIDSNSNLYITQPLNYITFMKALENAKVVITDSGGVQEEAIMLGTPCVTARDTTEWPETVWAGGNQLAGPEAKNVARLATQLLEKASDDPLIPTNPFQGNAGPTIIDTLVQLCQREQLKPPKPDMAFGRYPLPWLTRDDQLPEEFFTTLQFNKDGMPLLKRTEHLHGQIYRRLKNWGKTFDTSSG